MNVKNYKININSIKNGGFINLPIFEDFSTLDQYDTIKKDFIEVEKSKSINPILDYEKTRLTPKKDGNDINKININLNLLSNGVINSSSTLESIGFNQKDVLYSKNAFKKSFLRLNFYDTDKLTSQRLVNFYTIFLKMLPEYLNQNGGYLAGTPKPVANIPVKFTIKNPNIFVDEYSEGFNLYHYKDEVKNGLPKELFMRGVFNNAKNGVSYNLMTANSPQSITNLVNKLHVKYILYRDNTGYYYEIDESYSDNIIVDSNNNLTIKLYEIIEL